MLVVVDQAEELLQGVAPEESSAFLTVLRCATGRPGGRVFGLLTLRSDFLGSFQNHPALRGVAFADVPLGLLPVERFPQVIEGPAARAEIALEPGLVASMVADARTDDALPLLAFTLREMYERCRDRATFTLAVYRDDLGGIQGAVARVVERIKADVAWTPEVNLALRRAFLKLVRVNDEGQFTRQPARWADLPDQAAPVLEAFVQARLLTSDGDMVEVAHESLFRVWPELAGWLDEGRELMLWKKNIQDEVRDWTSHDRSPEWLLSGARVAEARRWLTSHADDFPGQEGEFLAASIAAEDRAYRQRSGSSTRLLKTFAGVISGLFAVAIVAWRSSPKASATQRRTRRRRSPTTRPRRQEADETRKGPYQGSGGADPDRDLASTRRPLRVGAEQAPGPSRSSWRSKLSGPRTPSRHAIAFTKPFRTDQDSSRFCTSKRATSRAWPSAPTARPSPPDTAAAGGGGVVLWDVAARRRLAEDPLPVKEGDVKSVAFSPDGKTLAAGYSVAASAAAAAWCCGTWPRAGAWRRSPSP